MNSIKTIIKEESNILDKELSKLFSFINYSKETRKTITFHKAMQLLNKVKPQENNYKFKFNEKEYQFAILSEKDIHKVDKDLLEDVTVRKKYALERTLKLTCS